MRPIARRRPGLVLLGMLLLGSLRCAQTHEEPADDPAQRARQLFELARRREPAAAEIEALVEIAPGRQLRATLLETLDRLGRLAPPRVEAVVPLPGLDRVAVDLVVDDPQAGLARFSVQLGRSSGTWKVRWLAGPEFSWPSYSTVGTGLASWPAAGNDGVR